MPTLPLLLAALMASGSAHPNTVENAGEDARVLVEVGAERVERITVTYPGVEHLSVQVIEQATAGGALRIGVDPDTRAGVVREGWTI